MSADISAYIYIYADISADMYADISADIYADKSANVYICRLTSRYNATK